MKVTPRIHRVLRDRDPGIAATTGSASPPDAELGQVHEDEARLRDKREILVWLLETARLYPGGQRRQHALRRHGRGDVRIRERQRGRWPPAHEERDRRQPNEGQPGRSGSLITHASGLNDISMAAMYYPQQAADEPHHQWDDPPRIRRRSVLQRLAPGEPERRRRDLLKHHHAVDIRNTAGTRSTASWQRKRASRRRSRRSARRSS
jgi:hypothetical protein